MTDKKIIGLIQEIELYSENGQKIKIKAKVDTGADSSSLDINLFKKLGYREIVETLRQFKIPKNASHRAARELTKKFKKEMKEACKEIVDVVYVKSSSGGSIRPKVRIRIEMDGVEKEIIVNLRKRAHLTCPMIIGKKDLVDYLIDPSL